MLNQLRYKLNLQLFAEDPEDEEIEFEIDDSDDGADIEFDLEDDSDDEVQEVHGQQGTDGEDDREESIIDDPTPEPANHGNKVNPTAAAVIAERKKWQAKMKVMEKEASVSKRFMEQIGVSDIDELNRRMDAFEAQKLQDYGVPEELAQRIAMTERIQKEQQADIRRQKHAVEVSQLKSDPFYADIDDHLEDLEQLAERTGMSIKAAYLAEHGERRLKEREAEIEARVRGNKEKRQAKKVDTSPTGSSNKSTSRVTLSSTERAIAKAAGMTPEEYAKFKKR